jgi:hypothetical protein
MEDSDPALYVVPEPPPHLARGPTIAGAHGNASGAPTFRRRSVAWARCPLRSIPASVWPNLSSCVLNNLLCMANSQFLSISRISFACYDRARRDLAALVLQLLTTVARLAGPGGPRAVVAESVLAKHQLLILNRSRGRKPHGGLRLRNSMALKRHDIGLLIEGKPTRSPAPGMCADGACRGTPTD